MVDDNEDTAETHGDAAASSSATRSQIAHAGPAALEAARAFRPDVVLLDIGLPGMDGYEVAERAARGRRMARRDADRRSPATARRRTGAAPWQAGFDHHLVKPVDLKELQDLLAVVVRRGV